MSFMMAMKKAFGLLEGQTNQQFIAEIRRLSEFDRAYFVALLTQAGFELA